MILFILKKSYGYDAPGQITNGLYTSAGFVVDMLLMQGHQARLETAVDGNSIDRLVTQYRPSLVVLEALWVTPEKMKELLKLHPKVRWVVRIHSEIPFLANEGVSVDWIAAYMKIGVLVGFNSDVTTEDFRIIGPSIYLPNYYPVRRMRKRVKPTPGVLNVGCFGAIRPLKNQLIQAFAAATYVRGTGIKLRFHMNGSRPEQGGNNNLKSIVALMEATKNELVLHPWLEHEDFLDLIWSMDICLQVSFTESFNITSADAVSMGVPLVGSEAIRWLPSQTQADVNSVESITTKMAEAGPATVMLNHVALENYIADVAAIWNEFVG